MINDGVITTSKLGSAAGKEFNYFFAYRNASQSIPDVTKTKIQFNAEESDIDSAYDAVTNYRFTAPATGYYHFEAQAYQQNSNNGAQVSLYKNGSEAYLGDQGESPTNIDLALNIAITIPLTTGDYIEVFYYHITGGARNIYGQAAAPRYSWFAGWRVR